MFLETAQHDVHVTCNDKLHSFCSTLSLGCLRPATRQATFAGRCSSSSPYTYEAAIDRTTRASIWSCGKPELTIGHVRCTSARLRQACDRAPRGSAVVAVGVVKVGVV